MMYPGDDVEEEDLLMSTTKENVEEEGVLVSTTEDVEEADLLVSGDTAPLLLRLAVGRPSSMGTEAKKISAHPNAPKRC